jgi:hypothetical protein
VTPYRSSRVSRVPGLRPGAASTSPTRRSTGSRSRPARTPGRCGRSRSS